MFKKNDIVFHAKSGILIIDDIIDLDIGLGKKPYYALKHYFESNYSTFYIPIDNSSMLKNPIKKAEANKIIESLSTVEKEWNNDNKYRRELYNQIFIDSDLLEVAAILRTIHKKKNELTALKKSLPLSDAKTYEIAKKLIVESAAYALNKSINDIETLVFEKLGE